MCGDGADEGGDNRIVNEGGETPPIGIPLFNSLDAGVALPSSPMRKPRFSQSAGAFHWRSARCSTAKRSPAEGRKRGETAVCPVWRICAGCRLAETTAADTEGSRWAVIPGLVEPKLADSRWITGRGVTVFAPQQPAISPSKPRFSQSARAFHVSSRFLKKG